MKKMQDGFTLVELALSMGFIGILSVAVALIIADATASYRRGLTLTQVTTMGSDIVDDMRTAVTNSSSRSVTDLCKTYYGVGVNAYSQCMTDGAVNFVKWTRFGKLSLDGKDIGEVPIFGAFCTGGYSYIWNTGYYDIDEATFAEKENNWATLKYKNASGNVVTWDKGKAKNANTRPRLLKVKDPYRAVCASVIIKSNTTSLQYNYQNDLPGEFDITSFGSVTEEPVDLILEDEENSLALFDLTVAKPQESVTRKNTFYAISFILGTITGGPNILAKGQSCQPPENYEIGFFDYCAINRFSFAVQAGGE